MMNTVLAGMVLLGLAAAPALAGQQPTTAEKADKLMAGGKLPDENFVMKAANGGMAEVELGKLAIEKAGSDEVKKFGRRMVDDHSKANDELKSIAEQKGVKLPTKEHTGKWSSDKAYIDAMVKDHEKDLAEFQEEAKTGSDPDVKKFAEDTAKMVQEHLDLAKETQSKLK